MADPEWTHLASVPVFVQWARRGSMMPAQTVLFHVSDTHFGVEDRAAAAWFAAAVHAERPDAVICTGDLTQRATHRQYAQAREWFAALEVPVMLQPGNHDMPYFNPWERFAPPFARFGALAAAVGAELPRSARRRVGEE